MRIYLIIIFLIFNLKSWSAADDLSEFTIEEISIGESLREHLTKEEINESKKFFYPNSDKFFALGIYKESEIYEHIQVSVINDDNYIIHSLAGTIFYDNNFEKCKTKMKLIIKDLEDSIPNSVERQDDKEIVKMPADKTGKSINIGSTFWFPNEDYITVECSDWADHMEYADNLKVRFSTNKYNTWLTNEAYD